LGGKENPQIAQVFVRLPTVARACQAAGPGAASTSLRNWSTVVRKSSGSSMCGVWLDCSKSTHLLSGHPLVDLPDDARRRLVERAGGEQRRHVDLVEPVRDVPGPQGADAVELARTVHGRVVSDRCERALQAVRPLDPADVAVVEDLDRLLVFGVVGGFRFFVPQQLERAHDPIPGRVGLHFICPSVTVLVAISASFRIGETIPQGHPGSQVSQG